MIMKKCAFLTMDDLSDFVVYDSLLHKPFAELGWQVDEISWMNNKTDWDRYRAVIIRSTWDYQNDSEQFLKVLKKIDSSQARLENNLQLVKWNINKNYLKDLDQRGVAIVPTLWPDSFDSKKIYEAFTILNSNEIILKPRVSANADHTFRLTEDEFERLEDTLESIFKDRPFIIQSFMPNIVSEGEYSLFYFAGDYSHAILKTPKETDFRVQEEHGGRLKSVNPSAELLRAAEQTMKAVTPQPLYARIDFVRDNKNKFLLMELELIEPSLYFNMDPHSAVRFARAFDQWMRS